MRGAVRNGRYAYRSMATPSTPQIAIAETSMIRMLTPGGRRSASPGASSPRTPQPTNAPIM